MCFYFEEYMTFMWNLGGVTVIKEVECFKYCSMRHASRHLEDIGSKNYLNCDWLIQEVSEEKNFITLLRDCFWWFCEECVCFLRLSEKLLVLD